MATNDEPHSRDIQWKYLSSAWANGVIICSLISGLNKEWCMTHLKSTTFANILATSIIYLFCDELYILEYTRQEPEKDISFSYLKFTYALAYHTFLCLSWNDIMISHFHPSNRRKLYVTYPSSTRKVFYIIFLLLPFLSRYISIKDLEYIILFVLFCNNAE